MLARFEREVKATAQLTHWNTVQVYDYGCTPGGTFYYAMEYLQGLNLRQLVDDHGPLPPGRVVFILRQLCGALHEAAQYGLVHRDIKPSNIFLAERGHMYDVAKLLDFGLVTPASLGTSPIRNLSHQLQGSPRYMCPEQAQGLKPDCRGDLYSLACVAYYLLSGQSPFEDDNPVMLVVAHASATAPRIEDLGIDVPRDLSDIVMKCLAKKPGDRYQTPRELQDALEKCDCAAEWSWIHAERWWLDHPEDIKHEAGEQTSVTMETQQIDPASIREPEPTFLCEEHARSVF
jgi:serine/threonine-protein kinase